MDRHCHETRPGAKEVVNSAPSKYVYSKGGLPAGHSIRNLMNKLNTPCCGSPASSIPPIGTPSTPGRRTFPPEHPYRTPVITLRPRDILDGITRLSLSHQLPKPRCVRSTNCQAAHRTRNPVGLGRTCEESQRPFVIRLESLDRPLSNTGGCCFIVRQDLHSPLSCPFHSPTNLGPVRVEKIHDSISSPHRPTQPSSTQPS